MDVRITVETTFDNGEKRIHQLDCQRQSKSEP